MQAARGIAIAAALAWVAGARAQSSGNDTAADAARQAGQEAGQAADRAGQEAGQAADRTGEAADRAGEGVRDAAQSAARSGTSMADACVSLLQGRTANGQDPDTLRPQCEALIRSGARVEAGQGRGPVQPGQSAAAAFQQAGRELTGGGPRRGLGMTSRGPVRYTLMTDPLGWFTGLGVNAVVSAPVESFDKLSWVAGARYSSTDASNGTATAFGIMAGADLFVIGRNNAGLRVGPRLEFAAGREDFGGVTTFGRLGLGGELGYNFIASNGLSASAALGLGGRIAGDEKNDNFNSFTGGEFGPYFHLGLGYSW